jgi:hypothetical protein
MTYGGVWNFGKREYADYYGVVSGKVYSRSRSLFLEFLPTDEKNNDRIYYEGGYYKINEVMYNGHNKKSISLQRFSITAHKICMQYLFGLPDGNG